MFYVLLHVTYVHSTIAIILMGRSELVALLNLSSWCLVMVEWLFLVVPWGCLRFVIVVFPDYTHYYSVPTNLFDSVFLNSEIKLIVFDDITFLSYHF